MVYLAMTAAELRNCDALPDHIAWMACHFSPYATGLTNVPSSLPPNSLLILNDRTPVCGHDPTQIAETLHGAVEKYRCSGILLDFQRADQEETFAIVDQVLTLPCPVCVAQPYANGRNCPVLLPPIPLLKTVNEYLQPWQGREIWLELALDGASISVTETGSMLSNLGVCTDDSFPFRDDPLHCHYGVKYDQSEATFNLKRIKSDLQSLQIAAEELGVTQFVGLWQELR